MMSIKFSAVKCVNSSDSSVFKKGNVYRLCHAAEDDVVETYEGLSFGLTSTLKHDSEYGVYSFEIAE